MNIQIDICTRALKPGRWSVRQKQYGKQYNKMVVRCDSECFTPCNQTKPHRFVSNKRISFCHSCSLTRCRPINVLTLDEQTESERQRRKKEIETNYDGMAFEILCIIISTTISLHPGIFHFGFVFFANATKATTTTATTSVHLAQILAVK